MLAIAKQKFRYCAHLAPSALGSVDWIEVASVAETGLALAVVIAEIGNCFDLEAQQAEHTHY